MLSDFAPAGRDVYSPSVTLIGSRSVGAQQPSALAGWKHISLLTERRVFEGMICCYKHVAPTERRAVPSCT